MRRNVDARARCELQLTGAVLDVGQAVDVELEDLRRVLHAEPVTGAQILVDPHLQLVRHRILLPRRGACGAVSTVPDGERRRTATNGATNGAKNRGRCNGTPRRISS